MQSLTGIRRSLETGDLTAEAAIRSSLEAIAARDAAIGAFVTIDENAAPGPAGPLHGIAVGIKDIIDTADMATGMGSALYAGWRPRADAAVVAKLKRLGATVIGKTATTAFAFSDPAHTRNPRNPDHTPGGSSSGSAAAVAAGLVPLTVGTQTGGSVIRPASFCGVAAIKPSFALLPTVGVKCSSWTLDTLGLFAAGVADLAYALAALAGRPEIASSADVSALRFGIVTQSFAGAPDPVSVEALSSAARAAEHAGATVRDIALPEIFAEAWRLHPVIHLCEGHEALAWEYTNHRDDLPPLLRSRLDAGREIRPSEYEAALRVAIQARPALDLLFEDVDALLTYSAPGSAPQGLESTGDARFNRLWTLLGVPCVNVPAHIAGDGLPVGVQVIAQAGNDERALAAAHFLERAIGLSF
jgi:Asp-tRNA(Asn)/Glu-tRNA(Gln) amidotransferase A subunit family amidase